ncbi:hypothetical protein GGH94_000200 [Coemansia aciculifera]|uniref:Uncharacterized protein n=1 Tax=Coemansia aciculifera TaxID=417176 RepID=A0A9W8M7K0_9FUNG|nr:hypothetical protein GGH94_000200 [Coemansia aciculifera]
MRYLLLLLVLALYIKQSTARFYHPMPTPETVNGRGFFEQEFAPLSASILHDQRLNKRDDGAQRQTADIHTAHTAAKMVLSGGDFNVSIPIT